MLIIQFVIPLGCVIYFFFFSKNRSNAFYNALLWFVLFCGLNYWFMPSEIAQATRYLQRLADNQSSDVLTRYADTLQDAVTPEHSREHDALENRAQKISNQMYIVYRASHSERDRQVLDKTDVDLATLRGEYIALGLPPESYVSLLDDLEKMVTDRIPTAEEEAAWNKKILQSRSDNQYAYYHPDFTVAAKAYPDVKAALAYDLSAFYKHIEDLLITQHFDELEAMAGDYRSTTARFPGGGEKLSEFYVALSTIKGDSCGCYSDYHSDYTFEDKQKALLAWQAQRRSSSTAQIGMAKLLIAYGWLARGHGFSGSVSQEQWAEYYQRFEAAGHVIDNVRPSFDPAVYSILAELALTDKYPRSLLDSLFPRAVADFPKHYNYYALESNYLQTRWYGAPGELQAFTHSLLEKPGGEDGQVAYTFIADELYGSYSLDDIFSETGLDWPTLKAAFEVREKLYGLDVREWNIAMLYAIAAEDKAYALYALAHFGEQWDKGVWRQHERFGLAVKWSSSTDK